METAPTVGFESKHFICYSFLAVKFIFIEVTVRLSYEIPINEIFVYKIK